MPGYVETEQPVLAWPIVRFAGEAVAIVAGADRYGVEDAAAPVRVDYEPLPAAVDLLTATREDAPLVHEAVRGNAFLVRRFQQGDVETALASSATVVERTFRTNRQCAAPMEGRGGVADWSAPDGKLTLWSATQVPHLARHLLAGILGLAENRIRVVAPDVGGGFGVKASQSRGRRAVCAGHAARPAGEVERAAARGNAGLGSRATIIAVRAGFDAGGRLLALTSRPRNAGAYSVTPWTAGIEALMAAAPHRSLQARALSLRGGGGGDAHDAGRPYRGVVRPATTFVMERVLDLAPARSARSCRGAPREPHRSRGPAVHLGDPTGARQPELSGLLRKVVAAIDYTGFRAAGAAARAGLPRGHRLAVYNELTGLARPLGGATTPFTGHEGATVRMDPSGAVTVLAGVTSRAARDDAGAAGGQRLGVPVETVRLVTAHRRHPVRSRRLVRGRP